MSATGERALAEAETWIGTPYRHQGATKGVGCDCLGLIRGVWLALYGQEPEVPGPYAADWAEHGGGERLIEAAERWFRPVAGLQAADPGDVLLFRFRPQFAAKHAGILAGEGHFIHAYEQAAVVRSALVPAWRRRVAGVYRFPEI